MSGSLALSSLDVEIVRELSLTTIIERIPTQPLLVLGSSQPETIVSERARQSSELLVIRRHGGGGAVAIDPASTIWIDVWVPRTSAQFDRDVVGSLEHLGDLFLEAFGAFGIDELHRAENAETSGGDVACFGSIGHGELLDRSGAKVLGITSWRCREGALMQTASYLSRETNLLVDALDLDVDQRSSLAEHLDRSTGLLPEVLRSDAERSDITAVRKRIARSILSVLAEQRREATQVLQSPEVLATPT